MRVVSLIAGITLLATGIAAVIGRRADVGEERDRRLETTAELLVAQLDATIARIGAVLTVATPETDVATIGDALALPVCAIVSGTVVVLDRISGRGRRRCRRRGPRGVVAAAASRPSPSRPRTGRLTTSSSASTRVPAGCTSSPRSTRRRSPPTCDAELVPVADEPLLRARTVDGDRMFAAPSMVEFDDGPWAVRTIAPAGVHLTADERWLIGAQLAVGAALAVLAIAGMVGDHRALQRRATTDALTRLPNRAEFERRATETLARLGRDRRHACLMVIDLDHFKVVNDTVGHDAGDQALVGGRRPAAPGGAGLRSRRSVGWRRVRRPAARHRRRPRRARSGRR